MTATSSPELKELYRDELLSLRGLAAEFGRQHPAVAKELGFSAGSSDDPHVELLLQSFAFLSARLRYRLEVERTILPNALLSRIHPHLSAPTPSMVVAQVEVQATSGNWSNGWRLERDRELYGEAQSRRGRTARCRFRPCFDTPLWPLRASALETTPRESFDRAPGYPRVRTALRLSIERAGAEALDADVPAIRTMPIDRLRLFIGGENDAANGLHDLLQTALVGIALEPRGAGGALGAVRYLEPDAVRWLGFADDEAALPVGPATHHGHRLLQEYFAFPEKFRFFELQGLESIDAEDRFDLVLLLSEPVPVKWLESASLELNCVPLVNLYRQSLEPVALDQRSYEYRLHGDRENHRHCEVYSVESMQASSPGGRSRTVEPYFVLRGSEDPLHTDYFYALRREPSHLPQVPGTEVFVSFLSPELDLTEPADKVVSGVALCTNRHLAGTLGAASQLWLEGPGPVTRTRLLTRCTPHRSPKLLGSTPWALASQLNLNYLSLAGNEDALSALRSLLALYANDGDVRGQAQIDSLVGLACEHQVKPEGALEGVARVSDGRNFVRGFVIRLEADERRSPGASAVAFASVLRHFFALYAGVNAFTQLVLETSDRNGKRKQWPALVGSQADL